ncbi:Rab-like protein 2A [Nowakowskiella sp. JEL0078]|nr:Rab-like protein 2A [Nowakowskiella sp. JEL0078]
MTHRGNSGIPILIVANKIDLDPTRAKKAYGFVERRRKERGEIIDDMPLLFCSASDGTNVVAAFKEAIKRAVNFKENNLKDCFADDVLNFIQEEERQGGLFAQTESDLPKL